MDLKELGSRLKAERERQGLTIEQVMELTKISRVNVYAIEDGNQKDFPHPVYAKGFIKNYAKVLGLDSEEIGEEFSKYYSIEEDFDHNGPTDFDQNNSPNKGYSDCSNKSSFSSIFMIFVLVIILAGFVYYLHDNALLDFGSKEQVEVVATDDSGETEVVDVISAETVPVEVTKEEVQAEAAPTTTAKTEEVVILPEQEDVAVVTEQEVSPVATTLPAVEKTMVITAKPGQACWLAAVIDGKRTEYVLQENESISLNYDKGASIKFGNAGGVDIIFEGKPFIFNAVKGKVKTIDFPVSQ